ncbi:hypothetical protein [Streptomyces sp. NPDC050485]|uniref:hypothetical protein n=1 Tax=Streptomyces sp. NPDC050485 TaxID=3365617 RepID=UPI0037A55344
MTTQPPPSKWAIARELVGLLLLPVGAFAVLFTLAELSVVHLVLALMAAVAGVAVTGGLIAGTSTTQLQRRVGATVAIGGYVSLTVCAFLFWHPLGNLACASALIAAGAWLTSEGRA